MIDSLELPRQHGTMPENLPKDSATSGQEPWIDFISLECLVLMLC